MSGYGPGTAQDRACAQRRRLAKLARYKERLAHMVDRLPTGWSPPQTAHSMPTFDELLPSRFEVIDPLHLR